MDHINARGARGAASSEETTDGLIIFRSTQLIFHLIVLVLWPMTVFIQSHLKI